LILLDNEGQLRKIQSLLAGVGDVFAADQAIIEAVYVLGGLGLSRQDIEAALRVLLDNSKLHTNTVLFSRVLERYAAHPAVSFTDLYLEASAYFSGQTPLYTFDKKLAAQLPHAEFVG
jgi:predicted nucleic-acid-binding protein